MRGDSQEPWYRKQKDVWYAWVNGRQVSLKVRGENNRSAAAVALGRLQAAPEPVPKQPGPGDTITVSELGAAFLADCAERAALPHTTGRMSPSTVSTWGRMVGKFVTKFGPLAVATLEPDTVFRWACGYGKSNASVNTLLTAVIACVRWGARTKRVRENPIVGLRRLPHPSRGAKVALTEGQFARLVACATNRAFRTFLAGMWHTGCRPGELSALTATDVDFGAGVATLGQHKTSGKTGEVRTIFLSPEADRLFRELVATNPTGPLFRNHWNRRWKADTLVKAMQDVRTRAGIPHAICYGMRHSYATAALVKGVPDATVAALLGHSGTAMLHKHYSHLTSRTAVMRAAAAQVHAPPSEPK